jgi:uncharacterized protein YjbI with pentapeptide repeats
MARPWIKRITRIAIATVGIAALAVPVVFPSDTTAIATVVATKIRALPDLSVTAFVIEIAMGAALAVLAAIWWLWWQLPRRQVRRLDIQIHDPKARADTEDNFRKTVGTALGGAAVLIGAVVAYWQFTQQQRASDEQSLRQQQAAHDLLISNQVSKGFEQLANDKSLTMRLGGIYGLEGVMNTSPEYHQPVLEALCAFVRDQTAGKTVGDHPATATQAALTVIGRRKPGPGDGDLTRADIRGANLSGANLLKADLNGADLSGAYLFNATLSGADLNHANLSNAVLSRADLNDAHLGDANLNGADLNYANLSNAHLNGGTAPNLSNANLSGANLSGADLQYAHLTHAHLSGAYLLKADLSGADLSGAYLLNADLSGAYLFNANLSGADLNYANLSNAELSGADLSTARNLTQEQLDHACGKPAALPPGRSLDKPCQSFR